MRAVLQRVSRASVDVDGLRVGAIQAGWLVLLGVASGDTEADAAWIADRVTGLRAFADEAGKMNRSVIDTSGGVLVVSQFTLLADCRKGRRPGFTAAADPDLARELYLQVCARIDAHGVTVAQGSFGAHMNVELVNDGPVTFVLDSRTPS